MYEVFIGRRPWWLESKTFGADQKVEALVCAVTKGNGGVINWDVYDGAPDSSPHMGLTIDDLTDSEFEEYERRVEDCNA